MLPGTGSSGQLLFAAYVAVFAIAALVCFGSLRRLHRIEARDVRRGLQGLLLLSGAWATTHVGFLLSPTVELSLVFYYVGLVVGIAAVGPWLYFCSAYTGRTIHRDRTIQRLAILVFLGLVLVKVTNPIHGAYFHWTVVQAPFAQVAIHNHLLHWVAMGLAYALATVGYFMLLELFRQVGHDTKWFTVLIGLTGLPIVLDVLALASPAIIDITYEPLGVAAFAVGVLYLLLEDFQTIQLAAEAEDPTVVVDDADRVRDYNSEAADLLPDIEVGVEIDAISPTLAERVEDEAIVEVERAAGLRYYRISANPFSTQGTQSGRAITLVDVTKREEYRRELERQNERLEQFASLVSHDLRNPLNVARGRVDIAIEDGDTEHLDAAVTALERMETLIDDLLTLAREGQPIEETERVELATLVDQCWAVVDTKEATLELGDDLGFRADPDRLQQVLENLIRNSLDHGPDDVTIGIGALSSGDGFYVEDDGPGIPAEDRDQVLESGFTTAEDGTGFGLSIVAEIAEAHGWSVEVGESDRGGARFEFRGVEPAE